MKSDICEDCGKHKPGKISAHGLCPDCAWKRMTESWKQLKEKKGPIYEKWKAGLKRSLEE